jgi:hypothetical protein
MSGPWLSFSSWAIFAVALSTGEAIGAPDDNADVCHANFAVTGSRLSGYSLKTFAEYPTVVPSRAFTSLARAIAADGGTLQNANEKLGTFSALDALGPGVAGGRQVNALVTPIKSGSRVELSWSVRPFVAFHKGDVETRFCKWLGRVGLDPT